MMTLSRRYTPFIFFVCAGLCVLHSSSAQSESSIVIEEQALGYMNAIWAADWETMGSYLTEETSYLDYTMRYFGRDEIDLVGRDSILAFYKGANDGAGVQEVTNDIVYHFVAGNCVVFELDTTVRADGSFWEAPGVDLTATFRTVSFVQVENGRIVRHIDFADYEDVMGQIGTQIEAARKN